MPGSACARRRNARGGKLLTGHHRQHSAIMTKAMDIVRSGRLGRPVAIVGTALFCKPDSYFDSAPRRRQPGRRADSDQHDSRDRQSAGVVRRDRRSAGLRLERGARLSGRGHRGNATVAGRSSLIGQGWAFAQRRNALDGSAKATADGPMSALRSRFASMGGISWVEGPSKRSSRKIKGRRRRAPPLLVLTGHFQATVDDKCQGRLGGAAPHDRATGRSPIL